MCSVLSEGRSCKKAVDNVCQYLAPLDRDDFKKFQPGIPMPSDERRNTDVTISCVRKSSGITCRKAVPEDTRKMAIKETKTKKKNLGKNSAKIGRARETNAVPGTRFMPRPERGGL